ncbi:transmembrane protein 217 [Oncorhynchus kisutch]|uniref:Transmembrane protein 217 n=1 Tax=Oncorhynchus kisutch TaxID=8019 RepID=A0A8C7LGY6_ONCKI|nr:transmembrane protein 217 [Oncorhynchus kisutch]
MKLLLSSGLCGMTPYQGSIVGGLYFLMVGVMQMVFEFGHLRTAKESTNNFTGSQLLPQVCFGYYYSLLILGGITLLLTLCMLGAVWAHQHVGILGFAVWLTLYDVILLLVTCLLQRQMQALGLELSVLEWYGVICRVMGDPFWLALVITHGLEVQIERHRLGTRQRKGGIPKEGTQLKLKFKAFDSSV